MSVIGNILWFLFGGVFMGLGWFFIGLIMFISIIGIPWGRACFVIAGFTFFPFGKVVVPREELTGKRDIGTGPLGLIGNLIWIIVAGIWLAIGHLLSGIACFLTIIGIPFGVQHFKLAQISFAPIGMAVVPKEVGRRINEEQAERFIKSARERRD